MRTDNAHNLAKIERFLTLKTPILHFWALTVFFTVLMVVFGQPLGLLDFTTQLTDVHPQMQIATTAVSGLLTIGISRLTLYIVSQRNSISAMGCLLWILVELIATVTILCLTLWQISGGGRLMLAPLAGDLVMGVLAVEALPYLIAYLAYLLHEEHLEVLRLQEELDALHPQDSVGGQPTDRTVNFYDKGKKLVFSTSCANILYIEAADNYVNIHYMNENHEDTFIIHNTLKDTEKRTVDTSLIRCHRGYIVNIDNVKLLRKDGTNLILELNGSNKTIPVTKTYATEITERLTLDKN